jgi:probable addiction module antidote protein
MSKRAKFADLPEFDGARYLDSESSIAAYLTEIIEANDAALMTSALRDIARARGMTEMARSAGICIRRCGRERSWFRLGLDTISRVCTALGVKLVV